MFSLLFTPVGRYLALTVLAIVLTSCVYLKIRADAIAAVEAKATLDALGRTENAIRSGDSLDLSSGGLRQPDKFQRND